MWSSWEDIEQAKAKERGHYGIYQIRILDCVNNPIRVGRIGGSDKEGIIYIGRAKPKLSLARRIGQFKGVAEFKKSSHHGADTYILMRITLASLKNCTYQDFRLQYRVIHIVRDDKNRDYENKLKEKIGEAEIKALVDYFSKYCELPPCNSSFPQKWTLFEGGLKKRWTGVLKRNRRKIED